MYRATSIAVQDATAGSAGSGHPARRVESLDGLRGVAALIVVIFHACMAVPQFADAYRGDPVAITDVAWWATYTPLHLLWAGKEAVLIFFVLSGLVLALPIVRTGQVTLSVFYTRRLIRLYLPVWGALVLAAAWALLVPREWPAGTSWWLVSEGGRLTVDGLMRDFGLLVSPGATLHPLWSLKWELVYCLLLPVVLLLQLRRPGRWPLTAAIVVAVLLGGLAAESLMAASLSLFAGGTLLAVQHTALRGLADRLNARPDAGVVWAWLAALSLAMLMAYWVVRLPGFVAPPDALTRALQGVGACLLVVIVWMCPAAAALLAARPVQWLGTRSFSLYLVHLPVLVTVAAVSQGAPSLGVMLMLGLGLSLPLAHVFYALVEAPSHRLARWAGDVVAMRVAPRPPDAAGPSSDRGAGGGTRRPPPPWGVIGVAVLVLAASGLLVIVQGRTDPGDVFDTAGSPPSPAGSPHPHRHGTGAQLDVPTTGSPPAAAPPPVRRPTAVRASAAIPAVEAMLPVAPTPGHVQLTPSGRQAWIAHRETGVVSVLDTTLGRIVGTVMVSAGPPRYIAFCPDGRQAFVSVSGESGGAPNVLAVIDTSTLAQVATIPVGRRPMAADCSPDGATLVVPSHDEGRLDVIDTGSLQWRGSIPAPPNPHWVTYAAGRWWSANHESNLVASFDAITLEPVNRTALRMPGVPDGRSPHSIAASPDGTQLAVVTFDSNQLWLLDAATGQVTGVVPVSAGPQDLAWSPDGVRILTTDVHSHIVSVVDVATGTVTAQIPIGEVPTSVAITPDGATGYVTDLDRGTLAVLDTAAPAER